MAASALLKKDIFADPRIPFWNGYRLIFLFTVGKELPHKLLCSIFKLYDKLINQKCNLLFNNEHRND